MRIQIFIRTLRDQYCQKTLCLALKNCLMQSLILACYVFCSDVLNSNRGYGFITKEFIIDYGRCKAKGFGSTAARFTTRD
jgi:hypothetical protein